MPWSFRACKETYLTTEDTSCSKMKPRYTYVSVKWVGLAVKMDVYKDEGKPLNNEKFTLYLHISSCSELGRLSISSPSLFVSLCLPEVPSHVCRAGQTSAQSFPADGACLQSENDTLRYSKDLQVVNLKKKRHICMLQSRLFSQSDGFTLHSVENLFV